MQQPGAFQLFKGGGAFQIVSAGQALVGDWVDGFDGALAMGAGGQANGAIDGLPSDIAGALKPYVHRSLVLMRGNE